MELASLVVVKVLSILPEANESVVADVVSTVVRSGLNTYDSILKEALNLYLELGHIGAPVVTPPSTSHIRTSPVTPPSTSFTRALTSNIRALPVTPPTTSNIRALPVTPPSTSHIRALTSHIRALNSLIRALPVTPPTTSNIRASSVTLPSTSHIRASPVHPPTTSHIRASPITPPSTRHIRASPVTPPTTRHIRASPVTPPTTSNIRALPVTPPTTSHVRASPITPPSTSNIRASPVTPPSISNMRASPITPPSTRHIRASPVTPPTTSYRKYQTANSPSTSDREIKAAATKDKESSVMFNEYGCLMEAAATPSGKRTSTETQLIGLGKKPRNMCSTGSSDLDQFNIPRRKSNKTKQGEADSTKLHPGMSPTPGYSSKDVYVGTTNIKKILCCSCLQQCQADSSVQCSFFHAICKSCLMTEICSVFTTQKMSVLCAFKNCSGTIPLGALCSLIPPDVFKFLKENISKKEAEASLKAIQELEGIVSCPRCPYLAQLNDGLKVFICANPSCRVECCRYCKAPWMETGESHAGCSLLMFAGSQCYKDISVLPANWTRGIPTSNKFQGNHYEAMDVPLFSKEFLAVCNYFRKTSEKIVLKVGRIQNRIRWEAYVLKRKHLVEQIGEQEVREKFLFHGTPKTNIEKICQEGFDFRKITMHGSLYGNGNYFSTKASYSESFSANSLFLVSVLCGKSALGHPNATHPPYDTDNRMCDSCVDNLSHPSMYIVYSNEQCYPAYVIEYI